MMCVKYFFECCTDYNELSYLPAMCGAMFVDIIQCILSDQICYNEVKEWFTHLSRKPPEVNEGKWMIVDDTPPSTCML